MPVVDTLYVLTATIEADATESDVVNVGGGTILRIETDGDIVGTALTFHVSANGTDFLPLYDSSGAVSVTVSTSRSIILAGGGLPGIEYLKVVSGSTETAGTVVTLVTRQ